MAQTRSAMLSARVHPSTKFIVDFYSRVTRRSAASWLAEAIVQLSAQHQKETGLDWHDYADVDPDVSDCLIMLSNLPLEEDEARTAAFIKQHRPLLLTKVKDKWRPDRKKISILWPQLQHHVEQWYRTKDEDVWKVGREMAKALKAHEIVVKWGPGAELE